MYICTLLYDLIFCNTYAHVLFSEPEFKRLDLSYMFMYEIMVAENEMKKMYKSGKYMIEGFN
jgi:hypothetical protein